MVCNSTTTSLSSCLRTELRQTTKFTPAMLLYGRELRAPAQIGVDTPPVGADLPEANDSEQDYASRRAASPVTKWVTESHASSMTLPTSSSTCTQAPWLAKLRYDKL